MKKYSKLNDLELISEAALESSLAGFWDWNMVTNEEYLSPRFKEMFGYEDHEMENAPESWQKIAFQEDLPKMFEAFQKHVDSQGKIPFCTVIRYHHKDGHTIWIRCNGKVVQWCDEGKPLRAVGCHIDITEEKKLEFELKKTVKEKTVLLKEVHHRVKNNLQLIQSLARLKQDDEKIALHEVEDAINAIANAHEAIYSAERFDEINLGLYLKRTITPILLHQDVLFKLETDQAHDKIDNLVQLGLILSECANNSLKHAFTEHTGQKEITIKITQNKDDLLIEYSDNGKGFNPRIIAEQANYESFGISLLFSLCEQINGTLKLSNENGSKIEMNFKAVSKK